MSLFSVALQDQWLFYTLHYLLDSHLLPISPEDLSHHVFNAQRAYPQEPLEQLHYACMLAGLHTDQYQLPLNVAIQKLPRHLPLILWHDKPMMVLGRRWRWVLIQPLAPGARPEWISIQNLKQSLAFISIQDEVTCIFSTPIQLLESPPENSHVSPLKRLWFWVRTEKSDFLYIMAYGLAVGLLSLVVPVALQSLVNTVAFGNAWQPVFILTLLALIGLGFSAALNAIEIYMVELLQQRLFVKISHDITWRVLNSHPAHMARTQGPELVNRFFDVVTVQKSAAGILLEGLGLFLQAGIGMAVLAIYHPILLVFDGFLLLSISFILFGLGMGTVKSSIKESKVKYEVAAWLEEIARLTTAFRTTQSQQFAAGKMENLLKKYIYARQKHFRKLFRQNVSSLTLQAISSTALLGIGGWLVIERQMSIGQLVAAELIVATVVGSFSKFGKHLESWYDLVAAVDKLGHLLDIPSEPTKSNRLPHAVDPLSVQAIQLGFQYPGEGPLFQNLNLKLAPGDKTIIWCPGASGKSTFCDLLFGIHQPSQGQLTLDGMNIIGLNKTYLRNQVVLIRHIDLFIGTIRDNLLMGNNHIDEQTLNQAIINSGLNDVMAGLSEGLDTQLEAHGFPLSASQARRLMFARAFLQHPRLLMIDETLDSIDLIPKGVLLQTLFAPDAPWTVLLMTKNKGLLEWGTHVYQLTPEGFCELNPMAAEDVP